MRTREDARRREVDEELAHHVELRVAALVREGMDEAEARRRVRAEAGDLEAARRYCARMDAARERAQRRRRRWTGWGADARAAARSALRHPGAPAAAVGVLAVALALNTVVFSLVRGVLLAPLPFPAAERVVALQERPDRPGAPPVGVSYPALERWRSGSAALEAVVAGMPVSMAFADEGGAVYLDGAAVTAGWLAFTGAEVVAGRDLAPADHRPDAGPVVVLSRGLWRDAFGGDPGVVGRTVTLDGRPHRVVGIASGGTWPEGAAFWTPIETAAPQLLDVWGARVLPALARLKPGVDAATASAELERLAADIPDAGRWSVAVTPVDERVLGAVRRPLALLQGAVALVLLVACANVGILLLARGLRRRGEMAVRKALGAGGVRVAAQGVCEALGMAGVACVAGLALAVPALKAVLAAVPADLPRAGQVGVDPGVVAFAAALALVTGLVAGLVPAVQALRTPVERTLRSGGAGGAAGRWARRTRNALVVGQVATSVVLVASAGLLLRSFVAAVGEDPGFRPDGVVTFELALPEVRYGEAGDPRRFVTDLLDRLEALPSVEAAAVGRNLPVTGSSMTSPVEVEGAGATPEPAQVAWVTPGYFAVMGTPVLSGRPFASDDGENGRPVAMVDATFAARFFGGSDPLGRSAHAYFGAGEAREVVGVAGPVRHAGLTEPPAPVFYEPFLQSPSRDFVLLVRSPVPAATVIADVRSVLAALDPALPVRGVATLRERLGRTVAGPRFYAGVLGAFALLSLALTVLGSSSVLSHLVGERRREIGIRMAMGAPAGAVRGLVVRQALAFTAAGLALGLGGALVASRALAGLLYRVEPGDPLVLAALVPVMGAAAALAAWFPARRASALDPARTLQEA